MSRQRSKMENPAFLDSDHSVYESVRGTPRKMSQRRQHHLPTIHHHAHTHAPRGVGVPQHVAHLHNGRVLGVTGVPGSGIVPGVPGAVVHVSSSGHTTLYPDPSLPPMYPAHLNPQTEPLYSCQAPRGHDHVYQCPGHRGDHLDHREHRGHHHVDPRDRIDPREQHMDPRDHHVDPRDHHVDPRDHHVDPRDHHVDPRDHHMDHRDQQMDHRDHRLESDPREHQLDPALDQRPDYHYGGSDYSSTEPIYAQPHLYPREGSAGTPTLGYNNARSSLRAASAASSHLSSGGTPAKYLVRSDSCGNSTSSSTLPTVSALLAREAAHTPPTPAHTSAPSLRSSARHHHSKGGVSPTPAKLKRQGLFRAWKVKFLRGEGSGRRACVILAALVALLVLGALAAILYLTLGGELSAFVGESPKLIEVTETGSSIVDGEFRITNQNFWPGLEDPSSEEYRSMAHSIENELDTLFLNSIWSQEYNHSQVTSLAEGSLLVQAQLMLNTADVAAAQKLGTAFLRGLHNRHGHEWLGQYSIDVTSIRFTEVLVDTPPLSTTNPPITTTTAVKESSTVLLEAVNPLPNLNVGWGNWAPWSTCSPCSPQYDQIRTRQCRLDAGRGLLVTTIEPCLPSGLGGLQGTRGDMETRPCQCHHGSDEDTTSTTPITTTTTTTTTTSSTTTTPLWNKDEQPQREERIDEMHTERLCDSCLPGEVCVGLQDEPYPTCRTALDVGDRTGCGGLCAIDSEVCQALGSRAFQCHSASLCLHDEWRCADGLCIPHIKRCDGHMNCYDQSDEQHCQCGGDQFQCGNNTSCLPITSKCDGKMDCWDGSDEANCTTSKGVCPNPDTQFTCRSSQCIPQHQFCDGLADCRDGSDEPFGCSGRCQANEHQCRNRRCIPASSVCDGRDTCGDGSDEQDCDRPFVTITPRTGTLIVKESSPSSWTTSSSLNYTASINRATTKSDRIWLLHLGGSNSSEAHNATTSNFSGRYSTTSILKTKHSPTTAAVTSLPRDFEEKSVQVKENISKEKSSTEDSIGLDDHKRISSVIDRGWYRTAQVMPTIEDILQSQSKSASVSVFSTQSAAQSQTGDKEGQRPEHGSSVRQETLDRVSASDSNMEMQGNTRTPQGFKINTPLDQEHS